MKLTDEVSKGMEGKQVQMLRAEVRERGGSVSGVKDAVLVSLLEVCGDVDFTATALTMEPPASWAMSILKEARAA